MKREIKKEVIAQLDKVTKFFSTTRSNQVILDQVNLSIVKGEMVLLLGPSGSGKTTLLTLLAGLQAPSAGQIMLFGKNLNTYSAAAMQKIRAQKMGFIFQSFFLIDSLTALENIILVLKFAGIPMAKAKAHALKYLKRFEVEYLWNEYPTTFSQGEKQRVAVARALANQAELIIADEPTGSLATEQGFSIIQFLKEGVEKENRSVIIVSHDERICQWADRVFHLKDGQLQLRPS